MFHLLCRAAGMVTYLPTGSPGRRARKPDLPAGAPHRHGITTYDPWMLLSVVETWFFLTLATVKESRPTEAAASRYSPPPIPWPFLPAGCPLYPRPPLPPWAVFPAKVLSR